MNKVEKRFAFVGPILLFAVLLASCILPAKAAPIAAATGSNGSYVVLGDDKVDQCPEGSLAAVGRDTQGKQYVGCWATDGDSVFVYWLNTEETVQLPVDVFVDIRNTDLGV